MRFRKAKEADIPAVAKIYDAVHTAEENGQSSIGWVRGVYPTIETARAGLRRGDLFVADDASHCSRAKSRNTATLLNSCLK